MDIRYQPVEGTAGSWDGLDFLRVEDNDEYVCVPENFERTFVT